METLPLKDYAGNGSNVYIRDILVEEQYLLLATDGDGLLIYDTVSKTVVRHFKENGAVGQTTANYIQRVVLDAKANIWLVDDKLRLGSAAYYGFQQLPFVEEVKDKSDYSLSAFQADSTSKSKLIISTPKHTILYDADKIPQLQSLIYYPKARETTQFWQPGTANFTVATNSR